MSNNNDSSSNGGCPPGFLGLLDCGATLNQQPTSTLVQTLEASIVTALATFGVQLLAFLLLRLRLTRIYIPRSYLVPLSQRLPQPPGGIIGWLYPLFTTSNLTLIQKCGLDAYFFLRYLRLLLKIFFPCAIVFLPILLPINKDGGGGKPNIFAYSIQNIGVGHGHYLWAHLVLAVLLICWICYQVFKELRTYVKVRQAYLTSPQHRIRASATTVLVSEIPRKWLTYEALSGLFDVYPGGIRNIWINRNFNELDQKVQERNNIAKQLESAETNLIKLCVKKHEKAEKKRKSREGGKKQTKEEQKQEIELDEAAANRMADEGGVSTGEQHEMSQGMKNAIEQEKQQRDHEEKQKGGNPFAAVGQGLGKAGHGIGNFGKGIGQLGGRVVGEVDTGLRKTGDGFNKAAGDANTGGLTAGFVDDDSIYGDARASREFVAYSSSPTPSKSDDPSRNENAHKPRGNVQPAVNAPNPFDRARSNGPGTLPTVHGNGGQLQSAADATRKEKRNLFLSIFTNHDDALAVPSPRPHVAEDDEEFPLHENKQEYDESEEKEKEAEHETVKVPWWKAPSQKKKQGGEQEKEKEKEETHYPDAFRKDLEEEDQTNAAWAKYIKPKDRVTMRLPIASWMFTLPFIGKKVDKIYHLRRELARLNLEIETDQKNTDKFPLMNSAFIQFNHQIAAHMCCQSLSHHVPLRMAPRIIEISPNDVIWDNMSTKWWERYLRSFVVLLICTAITILWAIPVTFTSALNKISQLAVTIKFLRPVADAPKVVVAIIQGVAPPLLLMLILLLVPLIFRALVKQQGVQTYTIRELNVQQWYFAFLFIQVFLIVTLTNGITQFIDSIARNPASIPTALASNLPSAATYFYSYLTVQALGSSAGALLQTGVLFFWFIWAAIFDSTPRDKFNRQTNLSTVEWGTFFPVFTNFAVIGIIYSAIAPLILVFVLFIFSLFWIVYRFNILYVYSHENDTGGRLFPAAINQLFVGLYFLELCLIGLFFTLTDGPNIGQGVVMIIVLVLTIVYQVMLNQIFSPFFQYLPITLEDEAVIRDEEFARAQASRFGRRDEVDEEEGDEGDEEENGILKKDTNGSTRTQNMQQQSEHLSPTSTRQGSQGVENTVAWHQRAKIPFKADAIKKVGPEAVATLRFLADGKRKGTKTDVEAQRTVGDVLYGGYAEDLEDISPDERDLLVRYAFQHRALRARRPVVWIPRDRLGVSDDEIRRTRDLATVEVRDGDEEEGKGGKKTMIWMSNDGAALDRKGNVVFRHPPPDLSNVDLIRL